MTFVLVTSNENKAKEIGLVLGRPVRCVGLELSEIQALDVEDVIEQKAREAFKQIGKPVLVEDTSLTFEAWDGLPGALIRWFVTTVGNAGLCKMLEAYENRDATAETCLGYFDGEVFYPFSGSVAGSVVEIPRGDKGFGWDPIFQPHGWDKTFAEMTPGEKDSVSMRKIAVLKLKKFLDDRNL